MIPAGFQWSVHKPEGESLFQLGIEGPAHSGESVMKVYSFAWGYPDVFQAAVTYLAWWAWARQIPEDADLTQPPRRGEGGSQ